MGAAEVVLRRDLPQGSDEGSARCRYGDRRGVPVRRMAGQLGDRPEKSDRVTTTVECCDYFHVRDDALKAHATQVDPTGRWFTISREMQTEVWPTEDFELAAARVTPHLPETDLFAGLEPGMSPGPLVACCPTIATAVPL